MEIKEGIEDRALEEERNGIPPKEFRTHPSAKASPQSGAIGAGHAARLLDTFESSPVA